MIKIPILSISSEVKHPEKFKYIIGLENVKNKRTPEGNPDWVFRHTYPSSDLRQLLVKLCNTINKNQSSVNVLLGGFGTGKSHILVLIYHFFLNRNKSIEWLSYWKKYYPVLEEVKIPFSSIFPLVCSTKIRGSKHRYLWELLFSKEVCGEKGEEITSIINSHLAEIDGEKRSPDEFLLKQCFNKLTNGQYLILLLDELDAWVDELPSARSANLNFIEKLAELVDTGKIPGIMLTGLRGLDQKIYDALARSKEATIRPGSQVDRSTVLRFRFFGEPNKNELEKIEKVVGKYIDKYKVVREQFGSDVRLKTLGLQPIDFQEFKKKMVSAYPFHPDLLDTLSLKYDSLSEDRKESIRGLLRLLMVLVQDLLNTKGEDWHIIKIGDADFEILYTDLYDEVAFNCASREKNRIDALNVENKPPITNKILNQVYFLSIPENEGKDYGASADNLIFGTVEPTTVLYEFVESVRWFIERSMHTYSEKGYLVYKSEKKPGVEIFDVARKWKKNQVEQYLGKFFRETFSGIKKASDDSVIHYKDEKNNVLNIRGKKFRIIYILERDDEDVEEKAFLKRIWSFLEKSIDGSSRNLVVIISPSRKKNYYESEDVEWLIREMMASNHLLEQYNERIKSVDTDSSEKLKERREIIKKYGERARKRLEKWFKNEEWHLLTIYPPEDSTKSGIRIFDALLPKTESIDYETIKNLFYLKYKNDLNPVKDEILKLMKSFPKGEEIPGNSIIDHFYSTIGAPIIVDENFILKAVSELVSNKQMGVRLSGSLIFGEKPKNLTIRRFRNGYLILKPLLPPKKPKKDEREEKKEKTKNRIIILTKDFQTSENSELPIIVEIKSKQRAVPNLPVTFTLLPRTDDVEPKIIGTTRTDEKGTAKVSVNLFEEGTYTVLAQTADSSKYIQKSSNFKILVLPKVKSSPKLKIELPQENIFPNEEINIQITVYTDEVGINVPISIYEKGKEKWEKIYEGDLISGQKFTFNMISPSEAGNYQYRVKVLESTNYNEYNKEYYISVIEKGPVIKEETFKSVLELEKAINNPNYKRVTINSIFINIDFGENPNLNLLGETGLPQLGVKKLNMKIHVEFEESSDPSQELQIINNLSKIRKMNLTKAKHKILIDGEIEE